MDALLTALRNKYPYTDDFKKAKSEEFDKIDSCKSKDGVITDEECKAYFEKMGKGARYAMMKSKKFMAKRNKDEDSNISKSEYLSFEHFETVYLAVFNVISKPAMAEEDGLKFFTDGLGMSQDEAKACLEVFKEKIEWKEGTYDRDEFIQKLHESAFPFSEF